MQYIKIDGSLYKFEDKPDGIAYEAKIVDGQPEWVWSSELAEKDFYFKFIKIGDNCYRKMPSGYSSLVEAFNTMKVIVDLQGNLPVDTLTMYPEPDFANPEQCAEEWLVANNYKNEELTQEQFNQLYVAVVTAWNIKEH